jgi:hypothetical protein
MFKILLKLLFFLFNKKQLTSLLFDSNYFTKKGFYKSLNENLPIDVNGNAIPWWTYSFVDFFVDRINNSIRVFEYGSGNSTIFLASHVKIIHCVEHDFKWYHFIKNSLPKNVTSFFVNESEYVNSIGVGIYDVIIIDGIYRNDCAFRILDNLSINGVIIFDDTDRVEYESAFIFLKKNAFKRIDFWGLSPCSLQENCTSIFYRNNNFLML